MSKKDKKEETRLEELKRSKKKLVEKYQSLQQAQNKVANEVLKIEGRIEEREEINNNQNV